MVVAESLTPPKDGRKFAFWGSAARLELPEPGPEVILRYATEPPHGDPLYSLRIDGSLVGADGQPALFWGRDLHLSACRALLALTSYTHLHSWFHVIHLSTCRAWSREGLVNLEDLSATSVIVRPFDKGEGDRWGDPKSIRLPPMSEWTSAFVLPNTEKALSPSWPRGDI